MKKLDIISTNIRVDSLSWLYSLLAQLTNQLLANFPMECRDFPFEIVKNCNGNLVIPNLPSGRKIDAKLLLRSISPTGCVYLRLLQELPYADGTLNPPGLACEQNEESSK